MTLRGLFSSWATPETSWPRADIFAAWTSCAWVSRRRTRLSRALGADHGGAPRAHEPVDCARQQLGYLLHFEARRQLARQTRQRLGDLAAPLRLAVEPRVLDGERGLLGQELQRRQVLVGERPLLPVVDDEGAVHVALQRERGGGHGLVALALDLREGYKAVAAAQIGRAHV